MFTSTREKENDVFRLMVGVLAAVGLWSLLSGASAGAAWLLVIPALVFGKLLAIALLFGFAGRRMHRRGYRPDWRRHPGRRRPDDAGRPSAEERFEEWHRMAHARREVDSWVEE